MILTDFKKRTVESNVRKEIIYERVDYISFENIIFHTDDCKLIGIFYNK